MKVSVVMTTYNHERYISQAVESALRQEVNFPYEIVLIEDCSTDRTREIVMELQRQHPEKIRLVLAEVNRNDSRNFARVIETSPSDYIACLEGDDYWTSPHKLQKQVDFLDRHPECAICFHNVTRHWEDQSAPDKNYNSPTQKRLSGIEDILEVNYISTCSVMFRRGLFGKFPEWFFGLAFGDWPLHILNAEHGKIGYLDETMAVYRVHAGGLWSKLTQIDQLEATIKFYREINAHLNFKYDQIIQPHLASRWRMLSLAHEYEGDVGYALTCFNRYLAACPYRQLMPLRTLAHTWLKLHLKKWFRRPSGQPPRPA